MLDRTSCTAVLMRGVGVKRDWSFPTLKDLHVTANALLRQAMLQERSRRWRKVVELYKELLWVVSRDNLPSDYEPPASYTMLLYEIYYHLGVAYQHLGKHRRASDEYTKAIEVVSIPKNGCLAGCLMNSCLMTPLYTRRAFTRAALDSYKMALNDAEKAVVLDSKNPDVYCIRALVRSTFDDELLGLEDLKIALKIDPDHTCALQLMSSFTKPLAERIIQEEETCLTCNSFSHPFILDFYDKFLFPLSVPHTITVIDMTPEKPSKKQIESNPDMYKKSSDNRLHPEDLGHVTGPAGEAFRCGTAYGNTEFNKLSLRRRVDYSNAIRKHMARPKSAGEFFSQLEKRRKLDAAAKRAQSAVTRSSTRTAFLTQDRQQRDVSDGQKHGTNVRPHTAVTKMTSQGDRRSAWTSRPMSSYSAIRPFSSPALGHSTPYPKSRQEEAAIEDSKPKFSLKKKTIVIETPSTYSIPVFQPMNIKAAPRMYYRPWIGDKLPAAERKPREKIQAFY